MAADDYLDGSDEPTDDNSGSVSSTYVELNERDHPTAYNYVSDGGCIRKPFSGQSGPSVHDFGSEVFVALGPMFQNGNKLPALKWLEPDRETVEAYLAELDTDDDDSETDDN